MVFAVSMATGVTLVLLLLAIVISRGREKAVFGAAECAIGLLIGFAWRFAFGVGAEFSFLGLSISAVGFILVWLVTRRVGN